MKADQHQAELNDVDPKAMLETEKGLLSCQPSVIEGYQGLHSTRKLLPTGVSLAELGQNFLQESFL